MSDAPGGYSPPGGYPPPAGGQPTPQGGYPPGGYPPPPGGNFPPPQSFPPGPGGYPTGYPGFGPPAYNVGEAFSWAWNKFAKNAVPLLVSSLVFGVLVFALEAIINVVQILVSPGDTSYSANDSGFSFSYNPTSVGGMLMMFLGWFLLLIVTAAIQSAFLAGVIDIANGQQVSIGSFFRPRNIGAVIIAGLIVGVATTIGAFLCVVPGLIASIMLMFSTVAVLDRNLPPAQAVKSSFETSKAHFGPVLLTWLIIVLMLLVGALLCGVGLVVATPLVSLMLVYAYRKLNGGNVAPAVP